MFSCRESGLPLEPLVVKQGKFRLGDTSAMQINSSGHTRFFMEISMAVAAIGAHAWGSEGHQVVALLAESQLSP